MVNSSTHINKTNNHLSRKESLISDGQQFNQYQQHKQLPLTLTDRTKKRGTTIYFGLVNNSILISFFNKFQLHYFGPI